MAQTKAEKQKAYRIRKKLKEQAKGALVDKRTDRLLRDDRQSQIERDTEILNSLDGADSVPCVCASYDGETTTIVGPAFGPVYITGANARKAYNDITWQER